MTDPNRSMDALADSLADYPRRVAEASEQVAAAAATTVYGADSADLVTVTASGAGEILSVRVNARALHDADARSLASAVRDAANVALARADAALADATASTAASDDVAARLGAFERRMDDVLDRLGRIDRDLEDRLAD